MNPDAKDAMMEMTLSIFSDPAIDIMACWLETDDAIVTTFHYYETHKGHRVELYQERHIEWLEN